MNWVVRLFDERGTLPRLLLLDLSGFGYLVLHHGQRAPTLTQWILALIAFVLILVFHKYPALNLAVQIVLLGVAFALVDDATINQVGASWAVLELAIWASRRRTIWLGAGALAAVYLGFAIGDPLRKLAGNVFGLLAVIGVPLLLGLVIRTSRELGRQVVRRAEADVRAARADERAAIARELHDVVAHHVASMVLRVGVARHVLPDADPRVAEVFDDVHRTGTTALADLRRLVALLRDPEGVRDAALTPIEPGALPAALEAAIDTARRAGVRVEAQVDPAIGGLDAVRGLAVLRLTQEALTNVAKHAGTPAEARLIVAIEDGTVQWSVTDSGGTGPAPLPPGGGHGLLGMRERVQLLGGRLEAGPSDDGWRVRSTLPRVREGM